MFILSYDLNPKCMCIIWEKIIFGYIPSLPAPVGLPYQVASAGDQSEPEGE